MQSHKRAESLFDGFRIRPELLPNFLYDLTYRGVSIESSPGERAGGIQPQTGCSEPVVHPGPDAGQASSPWWSPLQHDDVFLFVPLRLPDRVYMEEVHPLQRIHPFPSQSTEHRFLPLTSGPPSG